MYVLFDISKTVYCRKLVCFQLKTKMAETIKTSHFQCQKRKLISVSLYNFFQFYIFSSYLLNHINQLLFQLQFSNIFQFLFQFQFNWNWFSSYFAISVSITVNWINTGVYNTFESYCTVQQYLPHS